MKVLLLIVFLILSNQNFSQTVDTTKYQWPMTPFNSQKNIGGTFSEYRSTSTNGHFHNGTDMSGAAGTPVYAVLGGTVAVAFDDGSTGYDSYVRITSNVNGASKNITYYHTRPTVSAGQTVVTGQQISTIAIDHIHLIEYFLGSTLTNRQTNAIRPDGGVQPYNDTWRPWIRSVKFNFDQTETQISPNNLGGKVDIIVHVEEGNGTSTSALNNGTYEIGYKILSEDKQTIIYEPADQGLRFRYYNKPRDEYVNINYYRPESNTSKHVYIVTNGSGVNTVAATQVVQNNFWDVDLHPHGNYQVMIFTKDTRGNTDTVYVPVTTVPVDLTPTAPPIIDYVKKDSTNYFHLKWQAPSDNDLKGFRLMYSTNGTTFSVRDDENVLTANVDSAQYVYGGQLPLYLRVHAVDTSPFTNVSDPSKTYGIRMRPDNKRILFVDGFNRTNGGWQSSFNSFIISYVETFPFSFESTHNTGIVNNKFNLNDYELVIWMLGDESTVDETFSAVEQEKIKSYLENGGKLFVSGADIAFDLEGSTNATSTDTEFLNNYLKTKFLSDNSNIKVVTGKDSTLFEGLNFSYGISSLGAPYNVSSPDVIDSINGSKVILNYTSEVGAGVAYTGTFGSSTNVGQVVVFGFPFETISTKAFRQNVMNSVMNYFGMSDPTNIENEEFYIPKEITLEQNHPNPFNPSTVISYQLAVNSHVKLTVYDILGTEITTLVNEEKSAGKHSINFDSKNLSSGVYFYTLNTDEKSFTKKMVFLK